MSKQTDKSLFIDSSVPRFYQQLLASVGTYKELGTRIVKQIKLHHSFRRIDQIRELSQILVNFPIKEYRLIGQYYLLWCGCRERKYHAYILENVIEQSRTYKTRALQSRAAIEVYQGNFTNALHFYAESFKSRPSMSEYIETTKAIAFVKSVEGFHDTALKDLEGLVPVLRYAEPFAYYDILNSYAVELGESGRKQEARNIIKHVLASPFIHAYPEWQQTARDLKEPNRSFIAVPSIEHEPVEIEAPAKVIPIQAHQATEPEEPARVISFPELREAPRPNQPKRVKRDELSEMTPSQKRELLLAGIKSGRIVEGEYNKLLFISGMVESGPAEQVIDLEDKKLLNDLIVRWANLIEPEELVAVMSALRDCKDDLRQANIIDDIIRKAFEYSAMCNLTEAEWRRKVECKLPEK
jgi:hypothetical protein